MSTEMIIRVVAAALAVVILIVLIQRRRKRVKLGPEGKKPWRKETAIQATAGVRNFRCRVGMPLRRQVPQCAAWAGGTGEVFPSQARLQAKRKGRAADGIDGAS
jgi:hypothetical protein